MAPSKSIALLFVFVATHLAFAQGEPDTSAINKRRLRTLIIGSGVMYGATLVGLNELWYTNSPRQSFRFFNDNAEWQQVDKIGHFYSSFYFSYGVSRALRWSHVSPQRSDLVAALAGFLMLVPIEIMDGYSAAYGASAGDLIADAAGPAFFLAQSLAWNEVRLYPKFSFHRTGFAPLRPHVLGNDAVSEFFKDYNGQTYWISVDADKFFPFPKWLNIAVGYGAEGMVYARNQQNLDAGFDTYRQYYLSLDLDLTAIHTRSKALKTLIFLANMIKIPAPTLEFSRKGARFRSLFF